MANPPIAFRDERLGPLSLVPPGVLRRLAVSAAPPAAAFSSPSASASRALAAAAAPPSPPAVAPPAPAAVPAPQAGGAERLGVELPLGGAAEADVLPGRAVRHVGRDGVEEAVLGVAPPPSSSSSLPSSSEALPCVMSSLSRPAWKSNSALETWGPGGGGEGRRGVGMRRGQSRRTSKKARHFLAYACRA